MPVKVILAVPSSQFNQWERYEQSFTINEEDEVTRINDEATGGELLKLNVQRFLGEVICRIPHNI